MDGVLSEALRNERKARRRVPQVSNVFHDGEEIRTQLKLYVQQNSSFFQHIEMTPIKNITSLLIYYIL